MVLESFFDSHSFGDTKILCFYVVSAVGSVPALSMNQQLSGFA